MNGIEPLNPCIASVDIGTTKIACIVGRRNEHRKIDILGYGKSESAGVIRGSVFNIESTVDSIRKAVAEASAMSGVTIKNVYVGIAGQHIFSKQQPGQIIRKNGEEVVITEQELQDLRDSMRNIGIKPGEEIIDIIPQEYTIDGESGIAKPVGMLGNNIQANYHIVIALAASARNICTCIKQAGLEANRLILEPIASAAAVLNEDEKEMGVALVDIGGGTTDLAIFYNNIIRHTKVIPLGGDIITNDIKEGCNIIKRQAEELKLKFGSALAQENKDNEIIAIPGLRGRPHKEISVKNLAHIIQARMEEIIELVYAEIRLSGYASKLGGGIVLTGGGSLLKHSAQLTQFITGMDVRIGYPNEHLSHNQHIEGMSSPIFSTGVGLVIEGFNRLDDEAQRRKKEAMLNKQPEIQEETKEPEPQEEPPVEEKKPKKNLFDRILNNFFDEEPKNPTDNN